MHGILLLSHRKLIQLSITKKLFAFAPKSAIFFGWLLTQYFVFMTWLVFRVEDTTMMIRSLKTFIGYDAHWNWSEFYESLPEVKIMTMGLVLIFIVTHGLSGKAGGFKLWLSDRSSAVWGIICGAMMAAIFLLRPTETIDFIYFRF